MKKYVLDYDRESFRQEFKAEGWPAFRADQILEWLYKHRVSQWEAMTNISRPQQAQLGECYSLRQGQPERVLTSADNCVKILLRWPDGATSETVFIPEAERHTVCISTQVGCPVGCAFCASGQGGLQRSLTAGEMVEQVLWAADHLPEGERISNVVIMGMGEPFLNYDQTMRAVRILNAPWALDIGARHITLSTVGIPDRIRQLAGEALQVTLAISLHAPDDELRARLIPLAKTITLADIFSAIDDYFAQTHREVTLEYVLLDGVNSAPVHAERLTAWASGSRCNVNLINYNPVVETGFQPASPEVVRVFADRLRKKGVNVHIRKSRGVEIDAACGQLRRRSQIPS